MDNYEEIISELPSVMRSSVPWIYHYKLFQAQPINFFFKLKVDWPPPDIKCLRYDDFRIKPNSSYVFHY